MAQLARDTGMTREGLYKALSADGNPSFATVVKVAGALGFKVSLTPVPRAAS
jgi:probable addiction module antidote protein